MIHSCSGKYVFLAFGLFCLSKRLTNSIKLWANHILDDYWIPYVKNLTDVGLVRISTGNCEISE